MSDDDLYDLMGPEPGESEPETRIASSEKPKAGGGRADIQVVQRLYQPVSITFLAEVLGRDRKTVGKRLANLEPISYHRGNVPLYDFRQAVNLIVEPRLDEKTIEKAIRNLDTASLPAGLQKDVWDAKLKAQKWMVNAGELWPTEDVLEVLSEAFQRLKTTTQLWIDQIADNHGLPDAARSELTTLVDALQTDLHQTLVEMPEERTTLSQAGELEDGDG